MKSVYFMRPIGQQGPIKIGCSAQPIKRLRDVETWSPLPLEIVAHAPGGNSHERILHYRFGQHRLHGEWFAENAELIALMARVAETGALPPMDIPNGPGQWKEAVSKAAVRRKVRDPSLHVAKSRLTSRISAAEKHAYGYGFGENRPEEIVAIIASYQGFASEMPGPAEMAMIEEYCATLLAKPKVARNWANWKLWAAKRDAGRAA